MAQLPGALIDLDQGARPVVAFASLCQRPQVSRLSACLRSVG